MNQKTSSVIVAVVATVMLSSLVSFAMANNAFAFGNGGAGGHGGHGGQRWYNWRR